MGYQLVVRRVPSLEKGPGVCLLVDTETAEAVAGWPCITGGEILDDTQYGGITPSIPWFIEKPIRRRKRPVGEGKLDYTILWPALPEEDENYYLRRYANRTLYGPDYFMIHPAGRSSGCIAIDARVWKEAKKTINAALRQNQQEGRPRLFVYVEDELELPYRELLEDLEDLPELPYDVPVV